MKVLIVESNADVLNEINGLLPLYAPAVHIVGNCPTLARARSILGNETIDILLAATYLPDGTVFDLLEELLDTSTPCDVVLLTEQITVDAVQAAMLWRVTSLLTKPLSWSELSTLIKAIAKKRGCNPADYERPLILSPPTVTAPQQSHALKQPPHTKPDANVAFIHIRHKQEDYAIPVSEIRYVEADGHTITLHTESGKQYRERACFKKYEERLKTLDFVKPHRSYLVALRCIEKLIPEFVVLRGGKTIPIAKGNAAGVKKVWQSFRAI
jgi:two-component system, LytTR family, response regulator